MLRPGAARRSGGRRLHLAGVSPLMAMRARRPPEIRAMDAANEIRLTKLAKRAGCAAKQPPGYLLPLLGMLPAVSDPRVLVGSATADDAAVYQLSDDLAL